MLQPSLSQANLNIVQIKIWKKILFFLRLSGISISGNVDFTHCHTYYLSEGHPINLRLLQYYRFYEYRKKQAVF